MSSSSSSDLPTSDEVFSAKKVAFSPLLALLGYVPIPTSCSYHAQTPTPAAELAKKLVNYEVLYLPNVPCSCGCELWRSVLGQYECCKCSPHPLWPIGPADKIYNVKPLLRMKKRYKAIKDATNEHSRNHLRRARKTKLLSQLACEAGRMFNVIDFIGGPNRPLWPDSYDQAIRELYP